MVTEFIGYPPIFILIVLGVGSFLAVIRPYFAFLFSTFILMSGNPEMLTHTRTGILGPYLNLSDACVLVAMMAYLFETYNGKKPIRIPLLVLMLLLVLTIATLQSFWSLGWTYETARAVRWSVQFPMAFFLAAYLVTSISRAKQLIGVLLVGSFLAAFQHIFFVWFAGQLLALSGQGSHIARTISFLAGTIPVAFLLTGAVWKNWGNMSLKVLCVIGGVLFSTSLLFNQTRSIWLAAIATIPLLLFLFQTRNPVANILRISFLSLLVILGMGLFSKIVVPDFDSREMVTSRLSLLLEDNPLEAKTSSRMNQFEIEMDSWFEGSLILGRGLSFFQTMDRGEGERRVAFGHLGYVTYLSQLGFFGLLVYGVYLPSSIVRNSRYLWRKSHSPVLQYLGLLGASSIIFLSIMFLMSSSFLGGGFFAPGALYGSVWALARNVRETTNNQKNSETALRQQGIVPSHGKIIQT